MWWTIGAVFLTFLVGFSIGHRSGYRRGYAFGVLIGTAGAADLYLKNMFTGKPNGKGDE